MKIQQDILIDSLLKDVAILLDSFNVIRAEKDALLIQPAPDKWSIAQVLEHLNSYSRYYLPAIDKALSLGTKQRVAWFNSGFWGNYFANAMKPKSVFEVKNKMKAPKGHIPDNSKLDPEAVLKEFEQQQQKLLQLLERSKEYNLNAIRIPISISQLVKLKLGDTFRFFIAHEQRHFVQARNTLMAIGIATDKFPAILQVAQP